MHVQILSSLEVADSVGDGKEGGVTAGWETCEGQKRLPTVGHASTAPSLYFLV
jgi:hypothetical protein